MIRHCERSPWLPLSIYLSEDAAAISNAADRLGGPALARLARSVIDVLQLGDEPTRRVFTTVEKLVFELEARLKRTASMEDCLLRASGEQDFAVRAEITVLVDEFRYQIIASQVARNEKLASHQRGAA